MRTALTAHTQCTGTDHGADYAEARGHPGHQGAIQLHETVRAHRRFHRCRKIVNDPGIERSFGIVRLERLEHLGHEPLIGKLAVDDPLAKAPGCPDGHAQKLESVWRPDAI